MELGEVGVAPSSRRAGLSLGCALRRDEFPGAVLDGWGIARRLSRPVFARERADLLGDDILKIADDGSLDTTTRQDRNGNDYVQVRPDAWVFAILLALLCRRHPGSYQKLPIGYQPSNRSMARMSINDATGRGLMRELLQSSCSHRGRQWAFVAPLIAADAGLPLPYAPRSGARRTERELWRAPSSVPLRQGEDVVADGGLDRHPVRGGAVPLAVAAKAFPVFPQPAGDQQKPCSLLDVGLLGYLKAFGGVTTEGFGICRHEVCRWREVTKKTPPVMTGP